MKKNYMSSSIADIATMTEAEKMDLKVKMMGAAKEADKFVKSYGFRRQMQMHARVVSVTGTIIKLKINVGGGAFTDGVEVTVCIPEALLLESKEVWLIGVKALIAHEFGHINFSDFKVFKMHQEKVANYFWNTFGLRNMHKFGAMMLNATEDGRMEKLQATFRPGMLKYFQFLNSYYWKINKCSGNELNDFFLQIADLSVDGLVSPDFEARYAGTECERRVNECRRYIVKAINCNDAQKCADFTFQMIEKVGEYVADLIKTNPDAMNQFSDQEEYNTQPAIGKGEMKGRKKLVVHLVPEKSTANPEDQMSQEEFERLIDEYDEVEFVIDEPEEGAEENQDESEGGQAGPSVPQPAGESQGESGEGEEESEQAQSGGNSGEKDKGGDAGEESEEDGDASGNGSGEDGNEGEEGEKGEGKSGSGASAGEGEEGEGSDADSEGSSEGGQSDGQDGAKSDSSSSNSVDSVNEAQSVAGEENKKNSSENKGQYVYRNFDNGDAPKTEAKDMDLDEELPNTDESDSEEEKPALTPEELAALVDTGLEQLLEELESETTEMLGDIDKDNRNEEARIQRESKSNSQLTDAELRVLMKNKYGANSFQYRESKAYDYGDIPTMFQMQGRRFRKEMELIFKNHAGYNLQNQRKGKLDPSKLWQLSVGEYRIFEKKGDPDETDYAVSILVDNSGSMGCQVFDEETKEYLGTRAVCAKNACVVFEEGLKGLVPLKIARFEENGALIHHEVRGFNEASKTKNYSWDMSTGTGNGNTDGFSIDVAAHELAKRPEKEKILFVLSDGCPTGYRSTTDGLTHVREVVEAARKNGIRVIAIRFGSDSVDTYKYMYQHSYITCHPKDIQKQLTKMLKKIVNK